MGRSRLHSSLVWPNATCRALPKIQLDFLIDPHDLAGVKAGLSDKRVERWDTLTSGYLRPGGSLTALESAGGGVLRRPQ